MPTQKLQPSRALRVIPSNDANIPTPNLLITGTTTIEYPSSYTLIDYAVDFLIFTPSETEGSTYNVQYKVNVGDVVYCYELNLAATIVEVIDNNTLLLNADIFASGNAEYLIYQQGPQTGLGNQGCVLYVGTGGDLGVITSGQDIALFKNIQDGTFFPINVVSIREFQTTAKDIIALW